MATLKLIKKASMGATNLTSFHGTTVVATFNDLKKVLGEPSHADNRGEDKVNFEWEMETATGDPFTVYDWKSYRSIEPDEEIKWHIGAHNLIVSEIALVEIKSKIQIAELSELELPND